MPHESFVYCWTDIKTNKLYIGSHKGTVSDGYVCSSKLMLEEYNKRPEDFARQIIAEGSFEDIRKLEETILKTLNVKEDTMFYNQHNGNGKFYLKGHTEECKKRLSILLKGKKKKRSNKKVEFSLEHRRAISLSKRGRKSKPFSDVHRSNISKSVKNFLENNVHPMKGKKHSNITKSKISDVHSEMWMITDPHGTSTVIRNLLQYCKDNNLVYSCMFRVGTGERKHHKNYIVSKITNTVPSETATPGQ